MRVLVSSGLVRHEDAGSDNFGRVLAPNDIRLNAFLVGKHTANVWGKQTVELVQDTGDTVDDGIHAADDMILKNGLDVHVNPFSAVGTSWVSLPMSGYDANMKFHVCWLSGSEALDVPAMTAWQVPKAVRTIHNRFWA